MPSFSVPLVSNCSADSAGSGSNGEAVMLEAAGSHSLPALFDWRVDHKWEHPRSDALGSHNMLEYVAKLRGVLTPHIPAASTTAVPPPLSTLVATHCPFAYKLTDTQGVKTELVMRGPVLATLHITSSFCSFWTSLLTAPHTTPFEEKRHDKVVATVVVALIGWTSDDAWLVAHSWGSSVDDVNAYGRNGCFLLKKDALKVTDVFIGLLPSQPPLPAPGTSQPTVSVVRVVPPSRNEAKDKKAVKARVTLGHGKNKNTHPDANKPKLDQWKQKVSAGDVATITLMAIVCAAIAVGLCIFLTRSKRTGKVRSRRKEIKAMKVKTA